MILKKADVISHLDAHGTRQTIYSLDFQPNSRRLATCGGDASVKIWNLNAVSDSIAPKEALLATLSTHSKPVNIVRWSRDGRVLASGSDDNYILIHKYSPGGYAHSTFGSNSTNVKNKENWVRCCTLQGHTMDVLDLDWAPNGLLASGSVDNLIMIWNVGYALLNNKPIISPYRILSGHYSFVKGVSFDPIGQYLVSCGADNLILVWHCEPVEGMKTSGLNRRSSSSTSSSSSSSPEEWSVVKELSAPMKNCADKGMYRRIHWSADGATVCVSSCVKSGKPVGMVLKRGTWETVADLVGHAAATASCRYCPYMLHVLPAPQAPVLSPPSPPPAAVSATAVSTKVSGVEWIVSVQSMVSEGLSIPSTSASTTESTATTSATPGKPEKATEESSAEKPEKRKRKLAVSASEGSGEKRYSTSSADRSKRQAIKNELFETEMMSIEDLRRKEQLMLQEKVVMDLTSDSPVEEQSSVAMDSVYEVAAVPASEPTEEEVHHEDKMVMDLTQDSPPEHQSSADEEAPSTPPRPTATEPTASTLTEPSPPKAPTPAALSSAIGSPSEASVDQTISSSLSLSGCEHSTLLALGDQSGVLSLWASHDTRPIAVLRGLFEGAITDMAWMRYGSSTSSGPGEAQYSRLLLACCSIDGHLALLDLPGERFVPFDRKEMESHCRGLYCEPSGDSSSASSSAEKNDVYGVQMNTFMPSSSSMVGSILVGLSGAELIQHQIDTVTVAKNGKKRIKPVQVEEQAPPTTVVADGSNSAATGAAAGADAEANEDVEWCWLGGALHKDAVKGSSLPQGRNNVTHYHSSSYREPVHLQPTSHRGAATSRTSPESSSDARRRIRFSEQHQYHHYTPPDSLSGHSRDSANGRGSSSSSGSGSGAVINDLNSMVRRKTNSGSGSGYSYPPPPSAPHSPAPIIVNRTITVQYSDKKTVCSVPIRGAEESVECPVRAASGGESGLVLTARNNRKDLTSGLVLTKSGSAEKVWSVELPAQDITVMSGLHLDVSDSVAFKGLVVAGGADGSLLLHHLESGDEWTAPLILGSAIVFIDIVNITDAARDFRVLAATALGDVFVWDVDLDAFCISSVARTTLRSVVFSAHCRLKIDTLLENTSKKNDSKKDDVDIKNCSLNKDGQVEVTLSSSADSVFVFRYDAQVWSRKL